MKRIMDRTSKAASKRSMSVQSFAGSILNKYKTGATTNSFGRLALSYVTKSQPSVTTQTLYVQVIAPKMIAPIAKKDKKVPVDLKRETKRVVERERVIIERQSIVLRDVTHVIREQRTIREIAVSQSVDAQTIDSTVKRLEKIDSSRQRLVKETTHAMEKSKKSVTSEQHLPKQTIPQVLHMPLQQSLKAEQRADYYKWLQAKLNPSIVIQSIRKLETLQKPIAKERVHLLQNAVRTAAKRNSPLQLMNARKVTLLQELKNIEQRIIEVKQQNTGNRRAEVKKESNNLPVVLKKETNNQLPEAKMQRMKNSSGNLGENLEHRSKQKRTSELNNGIHTPIELEQVVNTQKPLAGKATRTKRNSTELQNPIITKQPDIHNVIDPLIGQRKLRLQTLLLQRKPLLAEIHIQKSNGDSSVAIPAKRLIHRTQRSQSEQSLISEPFNIPKPIIAKQNIAAQSLVDGNSHNHINPVALSKPFSTNEFKVVLDKKVVVDKKIVVDKTSASASTETRNEQNKSIHAVATKIIKLKDDTSKRITITARKLFHAKPVMTVSRNFELSLVRVKEFQQLAIELNEKQRTLASSQTRKAIIVHRDVAASAVVKERPEQDESQSAATSVIKSKKTNVSVDLAIDKRVAIGSSLERQQMHMVRGKIIKRTWNDRTKPAHSAFLLAHKQVVSSPVDGGAASITRNAPLTKVGKPVSDNQIARKRSRDKAAMVQRTANQQSQAAATKQRFVNRQSPVGGTVQRAANQQGAASNMQNKMTFVTSAAETAAAWEKRSMLVLNRAELTTVLNADAAKSRIMEHADVQSSARDGSLAQSSKPILSKQHVRVVNRQGTVLAQQSSVANSSVGLSRQQWSSQTVSSVNDKANLSYALQSSNRSAAGQVAVQRNQSTIVASPLERNNMPTLSHHVPKQPTAQEQPREVKVEAPRELDPVKLEKMIMKMPQFHPEAIADQVYRALERKMKQEQRRRGY